MYCDIMGSTNFRWFFVFFYYFAVVIGINIVVAFAIDMFTAVERLDNDRSETFQLLEKELTKAPREDSEEKKQN